ncbi:MAG: hypothetical protein OEQ13_13845, partial [Acidobacteriota bacterium]|nr:hypothetical protein [Acidobacteriota bacterium]
MTTLPPRRAAVIACAALASLAGAVPEALAAGEKKPFDLEAFHRVVYIPEMTLSPEGTRIAYVRRERDLPRAKQTEDVWLIGTDGKNERRLTWKPDSGESSLAWSPDGSSIAFVADRGDGDQIWLLPTTGGEARPLISVSGGASDLVWSPDGKRIAFTSDVYEECGARDECNAKREKQMSDGAVNAHVADRLFYRHWTHWWDGKVPHVLVMDVGTGAVRDLTPWRATAPVFYLWGGVSYDFAGGGAELVFQRNAGPAENAASSTNDDLWAVKVELDREKPLSAPRNLTGRNRAWDGTPKVSPDGRHVAFRRQRQPGYESDEHELAVLELSTREVRVLTGSYDNWVDDHAWLPDGSGLVFLSEEGGRTPLYRVLLADGRIERVVSDATIDHFELGPRGEIAYVVRRAVGDPPEIVAYDLTGKAGPRRITSLNQALAQEYDIRPAERMTVKGAGDYDVELFIVKP